ncbi:MAG: PAS domain-containing protein [Lachnospiraceae bacterium]|nr:PAS domain-containing protein [Lachnospiraceae bacterium]
MQHYENYISLTTIDKIILSSYKDMILQLGNYLGEGYEIILHSLEDLHHSVIAIVNGNYSGRKEGSPITNLALEMLTRIEHTKDFSAINYINKSASGTPLRSSTIPILGERNRIIGLLCINFYTNIPLSSILAKFDPSSVANAALPEISEAFTDNTEELIRQSVMDIRKQVYNDSSITQQNKNKEIIAKLHDKGIFNLKDSVIKVAESLQISKNTVYMHIRGIKDNN